jgi:hypothetical protein
MRAPTANRISESSTFGTNICKRSSIICLFGSQISFAMRQPLPRWAVPILLGLFALIALTYSVITPAFETPDEIWHYAFIQHVASGQGLPVATPNTTALFRQQGTQAPGYYLAAAALTWWIDQSDFPAIYARQNPHAAIGHADPNGNINRLIHHRDEGWPWHGTMLALHIARIFSALLGVVTLWASYRTVALLVGERAALVGTAVMAFTPQFVFISAAASNDNMVNALAALVIWQVVGLVMAPPTPSTRPRRFAMLGVLLGLAALSKLSALGLVGVAGLTLLGLAWKERSWRIILDAAIWIALPVALIAGWWYVRNLLLYNDLLAWNLWEANILLRVVPADASKIIGELGILFKSYWGHFGWLNIPYPDWLYRYVFVPITLLVIVGALIAAVRNYRRILTVDARWFAAAILLLWLALLFVSWIRFMIVAPAAQGRYFFPAAPTIAFFAAVGLAQWQRWRVDLLVALALALLTLLTPRWLLMPAYSSPAPVASMPSTLTPVHVPFGEGITLAGVEVPDVTLLPGEVFTVTAAWRADAQTSRDLSVFVHVIDDDGLIAAQLDTMPAGGLAPTSQWRAGDLYIDHYRVRVPSTAYTPNQGRVAIGLYDALVPDQPRQQILDGADVGPGTIENNALLFGQVAIEPPAGELPNQMRVDFTDNITLAGYQFSQRRLHAGDTLTVTLYWQSRGAVSKEYTTFVHLLDTDFAMFGGHDGRPSTATPTWRAGETIEDVHTFTLPPETPTGSYQIELGLYDDEHDRLPLVTTEGAEGADRLLLGPLEVVAD